MLIYDLECEISFAHAIDEPQRNAFNEEAGARRAGWHSPQPVISWKGEDAALIFLVTKGPDPADPDGQAGLCAEAEEGIRAWARQAGIPAPTVGAAIVICRATPRV